MSWELPWVGRLFLVVLVALSIFQFHLITNSSQQLYVYTHKIMSYFAPNITAAFVLGVLTRHINGVGAVVVLYGGFVVSISRFLLEAIFSDKSVYGDNVFLQVCVYSNFMHFAAVFGFSSMAVLTVVSLLARRSRWAETDGNGLSVDSKSFGKRRDGSSSSTDAQELQDQDKARQYDDLVEEEREAADTASQVDAQPTPDAHQLELADRTVTESESQGIIVSEQQDQEGQLAQFVSPALTAATDEPLVGEEDATYPLPASSPTEAKQQAMSSSQYTDFWRNDKIRNGINIAGSVVLSAVLVALLFVFR